MTTTWSNIVAREEPVEKKEENPLPLGWVCITKDKNTWKTVIYQNENDPYLVEEPMDWDKKMSEAICKMRARWENHHYLAGTFYDYDIHEDIDDYDDDESEGSESDTDDEQNVHLAGGGRYYDDLS
tara:strand:- start:3616 stop:3993 length:378 start_codon:yes stop_codon:yes gene_type:complete